MCTAIHFTACSSYFGRNLDLEYCNSESVTITPRNFPFHFRNEQTIKQHYAIIGISTNVNGFPLYYDAANESGLAIAGLNFPGNAHYGISYNKPHTVSPFELIPWTLSQCKDIQEAISLLDKTQLSDIPFSEEYPLTDLHWILCDKQSSIVVEPTENGLEISPNPVGVLTNNPPFNYHLYNLSNYMSLSNQTPKNNLAPAIKLKPYSRGMGAYGLPGDLSSSSRFVRAVFTKLNSVTPNSEDASVNQFFHILGSVSQKEGCVIVNGAFEKTVYTSCCNLSKAIYYYTTYENQQIQSVDLHSVDLKDNRLYSIALDRSYSIQNLKFS